ncbi:MAG: sigma 54-interacting transcriptional regulator [Chitinophagales bacterium]
MKEKQVMELRTLGALKKAGYISRPVKDELRANLIKVMREGKDPFQGIHGFEHTVIPDLERAILSRHNIILLGLRGQAKTRIARLLTQLMDEYIPIVAGSELNDDPFAPLSRYAKDKIAELGDDTPVEWLHRDARYTEKLATPDVSIADLIGDVDPIKAANLKLPYNDERVIHFGLIPRAHRGIFVINELPDLQARIQVALFNILQEGDIQIRGFNIRLPLNIQFVFTANPEDYTNRGAIVTPLKDRIESQILTHYPKDLETAKHITHQEADLHPDQKERVQYNNIIQDLIEQIAFEARASEYVDQKSGVSARMTISAFENIVSAAERRVLKNGEDNAYIRIGDLWGVIPAITGKVELVYEGEQEGPYIVAVNLIGKAIRAQFGNYFPLPEKKTKLQAKKNGNTENASMGLYRDIIDWFNEGNTLDLMNNASEKEYRDGLDSVPGLRMIVRKYNKGLDAETEHFMMEFLLYGLAEYSLLSKNMLVAGISFKDLFTSVFNEEDLFEEDPDDEI